MIIKRAFNLGITLRSIQAKKAATIAKFSPLTAVKCVRPTLRICATNLELSLVVSPITNPGIRAPASPLIRLASSLNLLRIESDILKIGLGSEIFRI